MNATPAALGRRLEGKQILVVDDDLDIAESMAIALQSEGAFVTAAHDGNSALLSLRTARWSVVVLDMMLPGFSGLALAEEMNLADDPPPIVMVTANQGHRHREYALSHGVKAYLQKPVALARLVETVIAAAR